MLHRSVLDIMLSLVHIRARTPLYELRNSLTWTSLLLHNIHPSHLELLIYISLQFLYLLLLLMILPGINVKIPGQPGHGSQFVPNTAGEKLRKVINSFLSYRDEQEQKLKDNPNLTLGDVTTINLTMLEVSHIHTAGSKHYPNLCDVLRYFQSLRNMQIDFLLCWVPIHKF